MNENCTRNGRPDQTTASAGRDREQHRGICERSNSCLLASAFAFSSIMICKKDAQRRYTLLNEVAERFFGRDRKEMLGRSRLHGEMRWIHIELNPIELPNGESLWNGIVVDITERKRMEEQLEELATTDDLTGLFNRRHFLTLGDILLGSALRYSFRLVVVLFDIDHFKTINDGHGHAAGDAVLRELGRLGRETLRASDILGRLGGDEFGVVMPSIEPEEALHAVDRLRNAMAGARFRYGETTLRATISCGVCLSSSDDGPDDDPAGNAGSGNGQTFAALLERADEALYRAKRQGRNRVAIAPPRKI